MTQRIVPFAVLAVVVIAGCTGGSTPTSSHSFEQHNTVYFSGTTTISNGSFVMRGELVGCYGTIGPEKCQDARILLYTATGSLFASKYVGTLHGRRNVSLVTDRIPQYVILTSPDFWNANHTTVRYIFYDDGLYLSGAVVERDELPVSIEPPTATANTTVRTRAPIGTGTASGTAGLASTASAVINSERVHSNIHVGEQHWETSPRDDDDWPDRSLSVEVDYYVEAPGLDALNSDRWTAAVERNLRLYGVDATLTRDEVLTRQDLVTCSERGLPGADDPALGCVDETTLDSGFTPTELEVIRFHNASLGADEYTLVAHELSLSFETLGLNLREAPTIGLSMRDVEETSLNQAAGSHVESSPYATGVGLVASKVQLHEFGHSLHIGERDDATFAVGRLRIDETYSGSRLDDTPESLRPRLDEWSIMRQGWDGGLVGFPMGGRYYAFSVEELATVEKP